MTGTVTHPLLPEQARFFAWDVDHSHFNVPVLLDVPPDLDTRPLARAVADVWTHHAGLRSTFPDAGLRPLGAPVARAVIAPPSDLPPPFAVERIEAGGGDGGDVATRLRTRLGELQRSFDLREGPLFRCTYLLLPPPHGARLLLLAHHLVCDGISLRNIGMDLVSAWMSAAAGHPADLRPSTPVAELAERLLDFATGADAEEEAERWLASAPPAPAPGAGPDAGPMDSRATVVTTLDPALSRHVIGAALPGRVQEALALACARTLGSDAPGAPFAVDLVGHGRVGTLPGTSLRSTVGWLGATYPAALPLTGDLDGDAGAGRAEMRALRRMSGRYGALLVHGDAPACVDLRARPAAPLFLNFLGQAHPDFGAAPFSVAAESPGSEQGSRGARRHLLAINASVVGGHLVVAWGYSRRRHTEETVRGWAHDLVGHLAAVTGWAGATCRS